jgi:hypothetical protein
MLLWFGCFAAAAVGIGMVQGLFFWIMLALRFWWVILIGVVLYYAYTGVSAFMEAYPTFGYYVHRYWWLAVFSMIWHVVVVPWWRRRHPAPAQVINSRSNNHPF